MTMIIKSKPILTHTYQPTGNTCGPTCLYMVYDYLKNGKHNITIKEIEVACKTDWIVGTPPERMVLGFQYLNIDYSESIANEKPYELLNSVLSLKNLAILRTITKGMPHWIIVTGFSGTLYTVLDPWLGNIQYYKHELDEIWKPRDYQFYEILL